MIDLKEYISRNPEALDEQEPPIGHELRFEAKLDKMMSSGAKVEAARQPKRYVGIFSAIAACAAAAVAAIIFINRPSEEVDWFAGVEDNPAAVYLAYSEKISAMYGNIFTKDVEGRWETTVSSIAEETVPMIDQLPDELDDRTKAKILKEYYGELLNGLDRINKIKEL